MPLITLIAFFCLFFCPVRQALAQIVSLDEVVVTANNVEEPLEGVPLTVDVIRQKDFESQSLQFITESFEDVSGVDVSGRGQIGEDFDLRIRGSDRDEVLVLLDGIPIHGTDESRAYFLNLLPVENIERVEVLKGSQSILYGSDAVGGVINILTKKGKPGKNFVFRWEGGNLSTFKETVQGYGGNEKTQVSAAFSRFDQGGFLQNSRVGSNAFSFLLTHREADNFMIRIGSHVIHADQELARDQVIVFGGGGLNDYVVQDINADRRLQFTHHFFQIANTWSAFYDTKLTYGFNFLRDRVLNSNQGDTPVDENGAPLDPNSQHFRSHSYRHHLDLLNVFHLLKTDAVDDSFQLGFNFDGEHLDFINNSLEGDVGAGLPFADGYPTPGSKANRQNYALYFQNNFRWKNLTVTAGLRYDENSTFGSETSPRVALAYLIGKTKTKIKGSYGEGFHAPTIADFYDATIGGTVTSIPIRRQQELSQSYEAGLEQAFWGDRVMFRSNYFFIDYDRLLDLVEAIDDASSWGVETDLKIAPFKGMVVGGNYTYNRTHNDEDGSELTMRPRHHFNAYLTLEPLKNLSFRSDVNYVSSKRVPRFVSLTIGDIPVTFFDTAGNTRNVLAGHVTLDLAAQYKLNPKLKWAKEAELFVRGVNVLNKSYEENFGYPNPGAQVYGGIKVKF